MTVATGGSRLVAIDTDGLLQAGRSPRALRRAPAWWCGLGWRAGDVAEDDSASRGTVRRDHDASLRYCVQGRAGRVPALASGTR